jgi:glutamine phosphoribosylpyrophosphate amidotransferase
LGYLSLEALRRSAAQELKIGICDGCFSGDYPVAVTAEQEAPQLSLFRAIEDEPEAD